MTNYSQNLGLIEPVPLDPATANVWAALVNENFTLLDTIVAGVLALNVAGASNVILTFTNGAANQTNNALFNCSGVLTGNVVVLLPAGKSKVFVVANNSTGAFILSFGVNNGSGAAAGTTATIPQGSSAVFYSDGTNVVLVSAGLVAGKTYPSISGGGTVTFATNANNITLNNNTGQAVNVNLPPSGNIPSVTVSSSGPSGNPGQIGSLWFKKP